MKRNRLLFCLLWLLSLAGISFYGGTVSYGFFAVFTLLPLVALVYLLCVYLTFRIYQRLETKQLVAKESIPFYFKKRILFLLCEHTGSVFLELLQYYRPGGRDRVRLVSGKRNREKDPPIVQVSGRV